MGLFSKKTKVYVASSVYNLAGDIKDRPNYLKTTVIGSVLANKPRTTIADDMTGSYLGGPGIRMRLFSNWSKDKFDPYVGISAPSLSVLARIDPDVVATQITPPAGASVYVQNANIGFGDFQEWCDQYIFENAPNRVGENFEIDIDDNNLITMTSLDGGSTIQFTPANFQQGALYMYVDYTFYTDPVTEPPNTGDLLTFERESDLPSTLLWSVVSKTPNTESTSLNKKTTVKSVYSDGRPDEEEVTDEPSVYNWDSYINIYKRGFNLSVNTSQVIIDNRVMTQSKIGTKETNTTTDTEVIDIGGGVTKTVTTTVDTEFVHIQYTSQTVSTRTIMDATGEPHLLIYRRNTGKPVLDAYFDTPSTSGRFYPFIPIREDTHWVEEDTTMYPLAKQAMRKATGGKLDKVIKSLKDNDDIDDIQYIYTSFGCSLNTPEDSAKEYIYRFFQLATQAFPVDPNYPTFDALLQAYQLASKSAEEYQKWWEENTSGSPVTSAPPAPPSYPTIPWRKYRVRSDKYNYDMTIGWNYAEETTHSGIAFPGAKKNKLKFTFKGNQQVPRTSFRTGPDGDLIAETHFETISAFEMLWQTGSNAYRKMNVYGLFHENMVYDNKNVNIQAEEAMNDAEESGFIVPLHEGIFRSMSLKSSTQLSTASAYLVLNCYKKVKQKWYQTGLFKIAVIVVAIVAAVFTAPAGGAGGYGVLGAYGAVGAAIGFAGTAAIVAGAIANAVAAMIIMTVLTQASTMLFGDKLGFIIGAVASFVAIQYTTMMMNSQTLSTMAANMMKAENIISLTSSVGNGISQYINASTADTIRKTEETLAQYNEDSKVVQRKYEEMFGTGTSGIIDPMSFISIESADTFLSRTLMTGSDVADMSLGMIDNFVDSTLDLSQNT